MFLERDGEDLVKTSSCGGSEEQFTEKIGGEAVCRFGSIGWLTIVQERSRGAGACSVPVHCWSRLHRSLVEEW